MKTQLLEDIGLSAPLSLVPSGRAPSKLGQVLPTTPRAVSGVWRQKPADAAAAISTQQPAAESPAISTQEPAAESAAIITQQLDELLTALEAPQPAEQAAPVALPPVPPEPVRDEAVAPSGPTFSWEPMQGERAPNDPLFDFTPPSPMTPAPDLFRREPTWFERSGRRYLLWGACAVAGALIIQGGLWLSQERKDADSLALVVDESTSEPQLANAVRRRAIAAKEFTLGSDGQVQVTPAPPASQMPAQPKVPPLVLLAPEALAAVKVPTGAATAAAPDAVQVTDQPELVAEPVPPPARARKSEREPVIAAPRPTRTQVTPTVREAVPQREIRTASGSLSAETLKACRDHGYQAAQCVKRACSVTKYGFVCRG